MIVLGIDPGSRVTGYGVIEVSNGVQSVRDYGVIKPSGKGHAQKLAQIHAGIVRIMEQTPPDVCAIEMPVYAQNAQSMLKLGRAQAAAMLAVLNRQIPVVEYTPKAVKKSVTGNGNATKSQVWYMVKKLLEIDEDRGLDAADALAVGLCHAHRLEAGEKGAAKSWAAFVRDNPGRVRL
ncbi:MAG TPA: crossover junction endodeoxyribonuclease RuvC [Rhodothermia bacterium]|nr:crossover junction endodeoxyribonuclease RuvC [Rhodothermia bacterium]